jgi:hypothetical protein
MLQRKLTSRLKQARPDWDSERLKLSLKAVSTFQCFPWVNVNTFSTPSVGFIDIKVPVLNPWQEFSQHNDTMFWTPFETFSACRHWPWAWCVEQSIKCDILLETSVSVSYLACSENLERDSQYGLVLLRNSWKGFKTEPLHATTQKLAFCK